MKKISSFLLCAFLLAACVPATTAPISETPTSIPTLVAATNTSQPAALWIAPSVPTPLRDAALASGIPLAVDSQFATQIVDVANSGSMWIYALVAPFPTVTDGVT